VLQSRGLSKCCSSWKEFSGLARSPIARMVEGWGSVLNAVNCIAQLQFSYILPGCSRRSQPSQGTRVSGNRAHRKRAPPWVDYLAKTPEISAVIGGENTCCSALPARQLPANNLNLGPEEDKIKPVAGSVVRRPRSPRTRSWAGLLNLSRRNQYEIPSNR
jgi:hypothetical protein